jgi:peptide/nickel transport system ATP-binding protein
MSTTTTLVVSGLRIEVEATGHDIVDEVEFSLAPGEVLGLVGESGSGKTTVGLAVLNHARRGVRIAAGSVRIGETDVTSLADEDLRRTRGRLVSYVPQDPSTALNPAIRIGKQVLEVLEAHDFGGSDSARHDRVAEVMAEVLLPGTPEFLGRYPHQLSGGQQQRVGLAMAFACRPAVIVLDEPTTGLDVSTQAHVLSTVRELCRAHGVSALYVTHDLAVVANLADRVAVMYAGRIVELAPTEKLFSNPAHPYTRHLTAAAPDIDGLSPMIGLTGRAPAPGKRPAGCSFSERCSLATDECRTELPALRAITPDQSVRCIHPFAVPVRLTEASTLVVGGGIAAGAELLQVSGLCASYTGKQVVHDVSFSVGAGECVAVVGESGSGKTTVSRSIGGLHHEWTGQVLLDGQGIACAARDRPTAQRLTVQYVFQNPYSSLHPRRPIGDSVARPLIIAGASKAEANEAVAEMLQRVSLTAAYASRYPDQLSGGERQRVAIARALVAKPKVLICDEVTSALDVLVQASIVELLHELRRDLGLAMVFVTHNLPLVRSIADRVAVMADGKIVEFGPTAQVIDDPQEEYTRRLLADTPRISVAN